MYVYIRVHINIRFYIFPVLKHQHFYISYFYINLVTCPHSCFFFLYLFYLKNYGIAEMGSTKEKLFIFSQFRHFIHRKTILLNSYIPVCFPHKIYYTSKKKLYNCVISMREICLSVQKPRTFILSKNNHPSKINRHFLNMQCYFCEIKFYL